MKNNLNTHVYVLLEKTCHQIRILPTLLTDKSD